MYNLTHEMVGIQELVMTAIKNGNKEELANLLKTDIVLLNAMLDKGYTALTHAIRLNKISIVELLLTFNELSLNTGDSFYPEAEAFAVSLKRYEIAQLIAGFKAKRQASHLELEELSKTDRNFLGWQHQQTRIIKTVDSKTINTLEELFANLVDISTKEGPQIQADTWATSYGISQALAYWLKDSAHIIHPDASSIHSLASTDEEGSLLGAIAYAKMIVGYRDNDGQEHNNGFVHSDGGSLKKPVVMIINTQTVTAKARTDAQAEGGNHWQTCVILPKQYQPSFEERLNNEEEIVYYLDSLYLNIKTPEKFKDILTKGIRYSFDSEEGANITHAIPALCPNANFIDNLTTSQQLGGADCGLWALYNALMVVFTGRVDYLAQFTGPSRAPAYKLRALFPNLGQQLELKQHSISSTQQLGRQNMKKAIILLPPNISNAEPPVMLSKSLPNIPYNRDELDEIIEKISLDEDTKSTLNHKLGLIENRIDSIHKCLRSKNHASFQQDMRMSLIEISDAANQIYELARPYRITLANQLQKKILNWIKPLDKELARIMEISIDERQKLEQKTERLHAQQSFICRQEDIQPRLMEHLKQIKQMMFDEQNLEPHCYLSYAWPSPENKGHEYWVQPFLSILYDHLTTAGIRMVMDIRDNKPGHDINNFMRHYNDGNHIILIGTESLLQKHASHKVHAVKTELSIINERFEQDQEQFGESRIYPLLISGTHKSSFPPIYDKYRTVREGRDYGYLLLLKNLIEWLYSLKIEREATLKLKHQTLWNEFLKTYPELPNDCTEAQVMQELSENYHRKRLDELNQDLVYQSIKAQQEIKHSEAVTTKIIAAYMESIGPLHKSLFEESGQQFNRPYVNPNFVERKSLWDKMLEHFNSQEKLVLMAAHGLGGMGKTELAGYYYQHPPRPYSLRAWFYAATRSQLYRQYIELAEANGKFFPKEMPIEEQARGVKQWLEEQKDCLLVYDNVENASEIDGLLPEQGKHHILITSRNAEDFPAKQCLAVDIMEEFEAIELIVKITGINKDDNLKALKELVHELGYLPLALAQAAGYMGKTISIIEYLTIYRQRQAELLSNKDEKNPLSPKHEPIWVTFDINFKDLNRDFPPAIATLKQASWVASQAIPEALLLNMVEEFNGEKDKLLLWANIKKHMHRYSFMRVDTERHLLSIHPVLQDILLNKQCDAEKIKLFRQSCISISTLYQYLKENDLPYRELLAHTERFHQNISEQKVEQLAKDSEVGIRELLLLEISCLGDIYFNLGLYKQNLTIRGQEKERIQNNYDENSIETAGALVNLGLAYQKLGMFDKANEYYQEAIKIHKFQKEDTMDRANVLANALRNLGVIAWKLGKLDLAEQYFKQTLDIEEKHYGLGNIETIETLINLGNTYFDLENFQEALRYYNSALEIQWQHYKKDHFKMASTLGSIGNIFLKYNNIEKAEQCYERALGLQEEHYQQGHIETAITKQNLVLIYLKQWKLVKAKTHGEEVKEIQEKHYGEGAFATAENLGNLANVYLNLGMFEEAIILSKKVVEIFEIHLGTNNIQTVNAMINLGITLTKSRHFGEAKRQLEQALEILDTNHTANKTRTIDVLELLGDICNELKEFQKAGEYLERILNIPNKRFRENSIDLMILLKKIGLIYVQQDEYVKAEQYILRAKKICNINTEGVEYQQDIEDVLKQILELKDLDDMEKIKKLSQQAMQHYKAKEYVKALEQFQAALKLCKDVVSEGSAKLNFNIGSIYLIAKDFTKALPYLQIAYHTHLKISGANNEATIKALESLNDCNKKQSHLTEINRLSSQGIQLW